MVLFWEVLETLGSGAELEEVSNWGLAFEVYNWSLVPSLFFSSYPLGGEQPWSLHVPITMVFGFAKGPESTELKTMYWNL
jgi:hypothetical protein